jgi:hypothetical protein
MEAKLINTICLEMNEANALEKFDDKRMKIGLNTCAGFLF